MSDFPISGDVAPGFEPVRAAFEANFADGAELGAGFAVYQGETCLVDLRGGYTDRARKQVWDSDTLVPVYSTTKPISAMVVALLIDHAGAGLTYETPVAAIWPEFAEAGKADITLAQVLSHQAGLPGFPEPIDPDIWLDPPALAAALAAQAPQWTPGDGAGYHPLTWGYLAGEIARRLSGKSLGTVLRETLTEPHGIDFWIGLPAEEHDRVADIRRPNALPDLGAINTFKTTAFLTKWASPNRGGAAWREIEIPSANGHGTAAATARLYGFFAGTLDIGLSDQTRAAFLQSRSYGPDRVLPFTVDFAAGVMRNRELVYGPNPNSYGHSGWGGSLAFGDPDLGMSGAYVMNRQSNILQGDPRALRLVEAVYSCI